jgi:hypothetical protein
MMMDLKMIETLSLTNSMMNLKLSCMEKDKKWLRDGYLTCP